MEKIALSDVIVNLRRELVEAQNKAAKENLKFHVDDISVELQVVANQEVGGKAGVQFWVVSGETGGKDVSGMTQKITLKLKPVLSGGERKELEIADEGGKPK